MSIALGIVLLGVLIGFLIGYKKRAEENKKAMYPIEGTLGAAGMEDEDEEEGEGVRGGAAVGRAGEGSRRSSASGIEGRQARRPTSLLATIDAATAAMTERMQMRSKHGEELKQQPSDGEASPNDEKRHHLHDLSSGPTAYRHSHSLSPASLHDPESPSNHLDEFTEVDNAGLLSDSDVRRARWSFDPQLVEPYFFSSSSPIVNSLDSSIDCILFFFYSRVRSQLLRVNRWKCETGATRNGGTFFIHFSLSLGLAVPAQQTADES
jgi:hypothetical protein